jgi:hypothetical protein
MADNSNTTRIAQLRNRTLGIFHAKNPRINEAGRYITDESIRVYSRLGQRPISITTSNGYEYDISACCLDTEACVPGDYSAAMISIPVAATVDPPYEGIYNYSFSFSWSGFVGATSYDLNVICPDPYVIVYTGPTSAIVYVDVPAVSPGSLEIRFTVTGSNACSSGSAFYAMNYPAA